MNNNLFNVGIVQTGANVENMLILMNSLKYSAKMQEISYQQTRTSASNNLFAVSHSLLFLSLWWQCNHMNHITQIVWLSSTHQHSIALIIQQCWPSWMLSKVGYSVCKKYLHYNTMLHYPLLHVPQASVKITECAHCFSKRSWV